jgi:hypothetical protein
MVVLDEGDDAVENGFEVDSGRAVKMIALEGSPFSALADEQL